MKLIVAYIRPDKLNEVKKELFKRDITKISITNALGHGDQSAGVDKISGFGHQIELIAKVRIEIAVNSDYVEPAIDAISKGGFTGSVGDGKIFVMELFDCVRIRDRAEGSVAIG